MFVEERGGEGRGKEGERKGGREEKEEKKKKEKSKLEFAARETIHENRLWLLRAYGGDSLDGEKSRAGLC